MEQNILIAGKNLPESVDLAESFALQGFDVIITGRQEEKKLLQNSNIQVAPWNKTSAVSARSFVIQSEIASGKLDNALLYFDAPMFASQFTSFSIEESPRALDEMVSGFQYLAIELLTRFEQHRTKAKLIFAIKTHPSVNDVLHSQNLKSSISGPANPFVAAAEASFATFAENVAALYGDKENITILLVTGNSQSEIMKKDSTFASWLSNYIFQVDGLKRKIDAKHSAKWIKAGAKNPGAFPFFN